MLAEVTVLSQRKSGCGISWPNCADHIHGTVSGVLICSAASVKNRAQVLNCSAAWIFLPLRWSAMAEPFSGGQVLLQYQSRSAEEDIFLAFCCIWVASCSKWKSGLSVSNEYCPWIKAHVALGFQIELGETPAVSRIELNSVVRTFCLSSCLSNTPCPLSAVQTVCTVFQPERSLLEDHYLTWHPCVTAG